MSLAHAPKTTCPRCLELRPSEIHTCSPTDWARGLEGKLAGLQADYDSRMEDLREADKRIADLEAFIVAEVDPMDLADRTMWDELHQKLHPENYR